MLALVLAGGELTLSARIKASAARAELVIAADSGVRHANAIGRSIDVWLGDFDSSSPEAGFAGEIHRFPSQKDQTDTHLALREAVRRGASQIVLLGALRG